MNQRKASFDYGDLIGRYLEEQYELERSANLSAFAYGEPAETCRVSQEVKKKDGKWTVYLIFQDPRRPSTLFRMPVKQCRSRRVAEIVGAYQCQLRNTPWATQSASEGFCWN